MSENEFNPESSNANIDDDNGSDDNNYPDAQRNEVIEEMCSSNEDIYGSRKNMRVSKLFLLMRKETFRMLS